MDLQGKIAIVTGGSSGIGQGIALKLSLSGVFVIVLDIASCESTLGLIRDAGGHSEFIETDVSDPSMVESAFREVIQAHGRLDILVNCAGINHDAMLHKMTFDDWKKVIDVDLTGTFLCTRQALLHMRPRNYGRIINISSGSWLGNIGQANYAAAKAGVVGLTKTAARENATHGITCNVICPGFITTPMTLRLREIKDGKPWESMESRIPMRHAGKPSDVANMVAFLASDEASYITSEVINVGGGMIV